VKVLTDTQYEEIVAACDLVTDDEFGPKVLCFPDGDYAKFFRTKPGFSKTRFFPYALRFARNAKQLESLNVPTVRVTDVWRVPHVRKTAVRYRPLEGETIRELAGGRPLPVDTAEALAGFYAELHDRGILFRSVHFGNVVRTPSGAFGLIDVADLTIRPWPLCPASRLRNFGHLFRSREDAKILRSVREAGFLRAYLERLPPRFREKMGERLETMQREAEGA